MLDYIEYQAKSEMVDRYGIYLSDTLLSVTDSDSVRYRRFLAGSPARMRNSAQIDTPTFMLRTRAPYGDLSLSRPFYKTYSYAPLAA